MSETDVFDSVEKAEFDEDSDIEIKVSANPEEAISKTMDNFAPKEANFSISIKMIPIMSFMTQWENRLYEWVGIPEGMNRPLLPENYFTFFTKTFDKAVKYSASRKGEGRKQIMQVLAGYFGAAQQSSGGFYDTIKSKFGGADKHD